MSVVRVAHWPEIEAALASVDVVREMELGFAAYSAGRCVVPPVGELVFEDPPGEVHIKYGYVRGEEHYVVKIASGFYGNPGRGLPSGDGMMLLFRQETGEPIAVLLDEGHLTDVRTAAAGAVAAKLLAPSAVNRIGILGTGTQARLQLLHLRPVVDCSDVTVWGRSEDGRERYAIEMRARGYDVAVAGDPREVAEACQLIVTTTPSTEPLLDAEWIRPGTHLTAVGSDTAEKQELDSVLLARADVLVADSLSQCRERGEISRALAAGAIREGDALELGTLVDADQPARADDRQITVADLTGVAVQDVRIASAVFRALD